MMRINKTTLTMVQLLTMLLFQTTTTASEILKAETLWLTGILLSHSLTSLTPRSHFCLKPTPILNSSTGPLCNFDTG